MITDEGRFKTLTNLAEAFIWSVDCSRSGGILKQKTPVVSVSYRGRYPRIIVKYEIEEEDNLFPGFISRVYVKKEGAPRSECISQSNLTLKNNVKTIVWHYIYLTEL